MQDEPRSLAEIEAKGGRVLIFIVACRDETDLRSVLNRIPEALLSDPCVDLLIIDDGDDDQAVEIVATWAGESKAARVVVLRNPVTQGYGGIQKLGYRFAVDNGYDLVLLVHGSGRHPPELLPAFIEKWRATSADLILGTRIPDQAGASGGGRLPARFQARMTGLRLQGLETGYRALSTCFLRRIAFEVNTNQAHFDTEILLQAIHAGAKVLELALPDGRGLSGTDSAPRSLAVIAAALQWKLHQMGMVCSLKYRGPGHARYADKTFMAYSSHQLAMREVERLAPSRVLDVGCGPGYVAERVAAMGAQVTGIDLHQPTRPGLARFVPFDLESGPLPEDAWDYDLVLLLDVIEHLAEPERFLLNLRNGRPDRPATAGGELPAPPALILSTPNVAFAAVRLNLLLGRFTYADRGILDITHKRLFTRRSLLRALEDCGYDVEKVHAAGVPFAAVLGGRTGRILNAITGWMARLWPTMFAFQFVVRCRPRPGVRQLLALAQRRQLADDGRMRESAAEPQPIESR